MVSDDELRQPSAPPAYPDLSPLNPGSDFRLREISEIEREISSQIEHYRSVLKKYKKILKTCFYSSLCCSFVSVALSSGAIASSLTGFGLLVGAPAAGAAAISSSATALLSFFCRTNSTNRQNSQKTIPIVKLKYYLPVLVLKSGSQT